MPSPVAGWPVNDGDLVTYSWLNALGLRQIGDAQPTGASVTFSSLPDLTYNGYVVIWTARTSQAVTLDALGWRWNGSSTAAYYSERFVGSAAVLNSAEILAATSARVGSIPGASAHNAADFGDGVVFFPFTGRSTDLWYNTFTAFSTAYNNTTTGTGFVEGDGGFYGAGGQMTSMTFLPQGGGNFVAGSRFTLYGVTV